MSSFDDLVAEVEQAPQKGPEVNTAASGSSFDNLVSEVELQAQTPQMDTRTPEQPKPGTSDNPFQGIITFSEKMNEAREVGKSSFRDSALGHAIRSGSMTLEEAEKQITADDHLAQMSSDLIQYEKDSALPWLTGIAVSTAKQLPMVEASLVPLAGGFAVGGGLTAATGVGAPIAVPVGATTGAAAVGGWTSDLVKGQEYLRYRREGMSHEAADWASTLEGHFQGALAGIRFGQAAKIPVTTAKNILAAHAESIAHMLMDGTKFAGQQILLSEAGTAGKLITDAIAGTVSKTPNVVPTLESAAKEFASTFNETLKGSIGLFAGGKATGAIAGATLQKVFKRAHDEHLSKQREKLQAIKDAEQADADKKANANTAQDKPDNAKSGPSKSAIEKARIAEKQLTKRIAAENEVRRIIEAASSRFYTSTGETRLQEVHRIQRLFKRMVKNSSLLDDKAKANLLARTIDIDGVKALLKNGEQFIQDQWGNEYANAMKEATTKLYGAIKAGQVKGKKSALPPSAQQSLKWYQEFFAEPTVEKVKGSPKRAAGEAQAEARAAALKKARDYVNHGMAEEQKRLDEQVNKLESDELSEIFNHPAELLEKSRIAMQAQRFFSNGFDQAGILELAAEIQDLVDHGKQSFLESKKAEGQRLLSSRKKILDAVQGIKPVVPSTEAKGPRQLNPVGRLAHSLRRNSSALWDKLLQDTPVDERQKLIGSVLDFTEVENKESRINIEAATKLNDLYSEAVGSLKEATRLLRNGADTNKRVELKFTDAEGTTVVEKHTLNQLTYLSMAMDDPGAVPGLLHGNGYTLEGMVEAGHTSTQEALRAILETHEDGKYLKLGGAVKDFYRWFAPQVANHFLKEKGVTLPMDDNYSGQIFHRHLERIKSAGDLMQDINQAAQRTLDPGSINARSNSKMPIKLVDPFNQVQRHRADMAFWIANSAKARELSFIFSDSTKDGLRDVIEHKLGTDFRSLVDARLAWQFHLKPGVMDIGDRTFQTIKSNMATGMLGARIDQAPKQWTSILSALSNATYAEYVDGLRGAMDKKRLQEYLSQSELYKDRQNHILPQILEATKERTFVDSVTGDKALAVKTFFLTPMHKWGDGVGAAVAGFIEYNRVKKAGGTEQEAVLAGDRLVDQTQSSSRGSQKVPAEMKGGVASLAMAFQKEGIQALNRESGAIRDYMIHKDSKHLGRMARVILSIHVAQTLFQSLNNAPAFLLGDNKEKQEAALKVLSTAIAGSYAQMPLVGFDIVGGTLSGWEGRQEPRTVLGGLASDSSKLIKRTWTIARKLAENEDVEGEDWVNAFKSTASVGSVATGLPFWGLWKYTELGSKAVKKATGEE